MNEIGEIVRQGCSPLCIMISLKGAESQQCAPACVLA